ncbi:beta-hexosaminidase 2-like [Panicum miliaceum]|uniref:Beta-hexosaminidase n=1 Tax=Panicum miliaceum TaxID=4540 RepID=A0A3L6TMJ0_PANMI|nr:beta-hexosaminidase 2-like [Panicum miliaceum]
MAASPYLLLLLLLVHPAAAAASSALPPLQPPPPRPPQKVQVWPKPVTVSWPTAVYAPLAPSFSIRASPSHPSLRHAIAYYSRLIRSERYAPIVPPANYTLSRVPIRLLALSVADPVVPLGPGVDESYTLSVPPNTGSADISSATTWGAIRGLETFSQLSWAGGGPDSGGQPIVPCDIEISDHPLFTHRGILLDTARNYYPVGDILRTIRAMAFNKLNVFHWHITDSQSFPIVLPSVPNLANFGSYSPAMRYTDQDVRRVVRFAEAFGIRVIPEIDMPGHAGSWAGAYPEIVTCANKFWAPAAKPALAAEPGTGQLNPLNPKTYRVAQDVLRDLAVLFPDPYLHGGADEVNTACWEDDPVVRRFLADGGSHDRLLELFVNATRPFLVHELNRTVVYWEDVLLGPKVSVGQTVLPRDTTVLQTWNNGAENTKRIVAAGYRAIVSSASYYYLDCGHGGWVGNDSRYDVQDKEREGTPLFNDPGGTGGSWCAPFKTWQRIYDYDILHGLTEDEATRVLGGEVALWSEQSDPVVLDARLWPRAAAAAETLWSGNKGANGRKRYANATARLNEWRYRMVARGIRSEPIQPLWCPLHPRMCHLSE